MAKSPLPDKLPGEFFVLEWSRLHERYTIHVDDEDASSYNLGSNLERVMMQFRLWGWKTIGYRAIDMAREFGAVQVIPDQNRTIALFNRDKNMIANVFEKEESRNATISL